MRIILILLLLVPLASGAQINRSAMELAGENIKDYISHKVFKGELYRPVSYGSLKEARGKMNESWIMEHRFEIVTSPAPSQHMPDQIHSYWGIFYLDKKMRVIQAEFIQGFSAQ